jgi:DNA-binding NarL/FixJ family response regulator
VQRRILIVDDYLPVRRAIRAILDLPPFQVCGEAKNGKEAIEKVVELKPDIVLLDINMPVMNGIEAAREIRRISPQTKIVFLTIHDAPAFRDATRLWSHAFVAKSAAADELIPTLNRLAEAVPNPPTAPEKPVRTHRVASTGCSACHPRDNKGTSKFAALCVNFRNSWRRSSYADPGPVVVVCPGRN